MTEENKTCLIDTKGGQRMRVVGQDLWDANTKMRDDVREAIDDLMANRWVSGMKTLCRIAGIKYAKISTQVHEIQTYQLAKGETDGDKPS